LNESTFVCSLAACADACDISSRVTFFLHVSIDLVLSPAGLCTVGVPRREGACM